MSSKKLIFVCVQFFALLTFAQAYKVSELTIKKVLETCRDDDRVIVQGKVTHRVGGRSYLLQDDTGSIVVKLPKKYKYRSFEGAIVRIFGFVDTDWDEPTKIKVSKIRILEGASNASLYDAVPENF